MIGYYTAINIDQQRGCYITTAANLLYNQLFMLEPIFTICALCLVDAIF